MQHKGRGADLPKQMCTRVTVLPASVAHSLFELGLLFCLSVQHGRRVVVKVGMGELSIVQKIKVKLVNGGSQAYCIVMNVFNCN